MLIGTTVILTKRTLADEYGVYRRNETGQDYLLLSFSDKDEALKIGFDIAGLLNIPFNSRLHDNNTSEYNTQTQKKVKQVRGIPQLCSKLSKEGKDTEEIISEIVPLYVEAGRTEKWARETVKWYLKNM